MAKDLRRVLTDNLKFFMSRENAPYRTPNALGIAAGIAPNTVSNLLKPERRTVTSSKPQGYPTLDKLQAIALALNCDVWELLHPDIERSIREREMYETISRDLLARVKADKPRHKEPQ